MFVHTNVHLLWALHIEVLGKNHKNLAKLVMAMPSHSF